MQLIVVVVEASTGDLVVEVTRKTPIMRMKNKMVKKVKKDVREVVVDVGVVAVSEAVAEVEATLHDFTVANVEVADVDLVPTLKAKEIPSKMKKAQ